MAVITNEKEFEQWLEGRPTSWGQIFARRAALRRLPSIWPPRELSEEVHTDIDLMTLALLRCSSISFTAGNIPAHDMQAAARDAASYIGRCSVYFAQDHPVAQATRFAAMVDDAHSAHYAASYASGWNSIMQDARWLEAQGDTETAAEQLTWQPLWTEVPDGFTEKWKNAFAYLRSRDPGFALWIDWYQRRIDGHNAAFDLPRAQDAAIQIRIAQQTDDFWKQGATTVNTIIQSWINEARAEAGVSRDTQLVPDNAHIQIWIDEARAEVQSSTGVPLQPDFGTYVTREEEESDLEPPAQNQNALVFREDEDGRIGIDFYAGGDQLDTSRDAVDRHAEALRLAQELNRICRASNNAGDITAHISLYIEALGADIGLCRPGMLITRGEQLRLNLAKAQNPPSDSLAEPLDSNVIAALEPAVGAHNVFVALDGFLAKSDQALLGPDAKRIVISPAEAQPLIADEQQRDMLLPEANTALKELMAVTPEIADQNDRRSIFSSESVKNLARKIIGSLWQRKLKIAAGAGSVAVGGMVGFYNFANWIVNNEVWLLKFFADYPNMLGVLIRLILWLKTLPLN